MWVTFPLKSLSTGRLPFCKHATKLHSHTRVRIAHTQMKKLVMCGQHREGVMFYCQIINTGLLILIDFRGGPVQVLKLFWRDQLRYSNVIWGDQKKNTLYMSLYESIEWASFVNWEIPFLVLVLCSKWRINGFRSDWNDWCVQGGFTQDPSVPAAPLMEGFVLGKARRGH